MIRADLLRNGLAAPLGLSRIAHQYERVNVQIVRVSHFTGPGNYTVSLQGYAGLRSVDTLLHQVNQDETIGAQLSVGDTLTASRDRFAAVTADNQQGFVLSVWITPIGSGYTYREVWIVNVIYPVGKQLVNVLGSIYECVILLFTIS